MNQLKIKVYNIEMAIRIENYFWGLNKTHLDIDMIFRDKSTGEYLCFDKKDSGTGKEFLMNY
jgi:hypothetical protein